MDNFERVKFRNYELLSGFLQINFPIFFITIVINWVETAANIAVKNTALCLSLIARDFRDQLFE